VGDITAVLEARGGIVFHDTDIAHVAQLPGLITAAERP
jgi:hypothetical protein